MKRAVMAAANSWDFCLFLLSMFYMQFFAKVQSFIASCDTRVFAIVCCILTYIVITVIKMNNKKKK